VYPAASPAKTFACAALALLLAACAPAYRSPLERDHPLVGRIWDTHARAFVMRDALVGRAVAARIVMLGEAHDNPDHHRLQAEVLAALLKAGRSPALAMEQFDREHQQSLDAQRAQGVRDPERIADAGRFDRKGWNWPQYRPLVESAIAANLPVLAANLSREDARALMKAGRPAEGLAPADRALRESLEQDIVDGHCGYRPSATVLAGMVEAQRARDAQMAAVLARTDARGAVLIAGAGHTRNDRGAPAYLPAGLRGGVLAVAFLEVETGRAEPRPEYATLYDLVWFTPRADREDPCKNFRMP
jgi:uncharacterized iron-regulated protein